jgi:predicted ATP-dependent serine protease
MESNTLMLEPMRSPSRLASGMQTMSARELVKRSWTLVESAAYPELRLSRGAVVLAYGGPGAGKSTWATRFADKLDGAAIYYSAEEKLGPTVADRLSRCGVTRGDFVVVGQGAVDDVVQLARESKAASLVVDSVTMTTLRPADLRRLVVAAGVRVLVCTQQVTKAGEAAGPISFAHEADVVIAVDDMQWRVEKSRYQACDGRAHAVVR